MPPWSGASVAVPDLSHAVREAVSRPSSCVPDGAILLSYVNSKHQGLRGLQLQRVAQLPCLLSRLVTVCYGVDHDGLGSCVAAPAFAPAEINMALNAYRKPRGSARDIVRSAGAYFELVWAKWRLLLSALSAAREVLWLDADVVLFRNPWPAPPAALPPADILYQSEFACAAPCGAGSGASPCTLNGGVMLVRSAALVREVVAREPNLSSAVKPPLDQDVADAVARGGGYRACPLPAASWVGFCWWAWGYNRGNRSLFDRLLPCQLVTFHAHCIGSREGKHEAMARMLDKTKHCAGRGDADTTRLGMWGPRARPTARAPTKSKSKGGGKARGGRSRGR